VRATIYPFPPTPEVLAVARRINWFRSPEDALPHPIELMAYAMKHATEDDMRLLLRQIGFDGLREAIDAAPPGIIPAFFDARSRACWIARMNRYPAPPKPERRFSSTGGERG
jgi:hypothetical protein